MFNRAALLISLICILIGLLLVGLVSGTPIRHVVQVAPIAVAIVLIVKRAEGAPYAALPLLVFWAGIMVLIWLFLLGIARITTGHFTPAEIALTIVIGAASAVGIAAVFRAPSTLTVVRRIAWALAFAGLQVAAMWLSLRPSIANI